MQVSEEEIHNYGGHFRLPFRGLPTEIRLIIWRFLIPEMIDLKKIDFAQAPGSNRQKYRFKTGEPAALGLLRVNKVVRQEFIDVARGKITFDLGFLPDQALQALSTYARSIVGSIVCSFFHSSGVSEFDWRVLKFRPLHFTLPANCFDQIRHIHLGITGTEWEEAAIYDHINPIAEGQAALEDAAMENWEERLLQRIEKRAAGFGEGLRHCDDSDDSEEYIEDPLSDISGTWEGQILRGDREAIEEKWYDLEEDEQEVHYHNCLFRPGYTTIFRLMQMVRRKELDTVTLTFSSIHYQQNLVLEDFEPKIMAKAEREDGVEIEVVGSLDPDDWVHDMDDVEKKIIITRR